MITKISKYLPIAAFVAAVGLAGFDKQVPLALVFISSIGIVVDLAYRLLDNKFNKDTISTRMSAIEADLVETKQKLNNVLLAKNLGGFQ